MEVSMVTGVLSPLNVNFNMALIFYE
jgi:hypothetical protein